MALNRWMLCNDHDLELKVAIELLNSLRIMTKGLCEHKTGISIKLYPLILLMDSNRLHTWGYTVHENRLGMKRKWTSSTKLARSIFKTQLTSTWAHSFFCCVSSFILVSSMCDSSDGIALCHCWLGRLMKPIIIAKAKLKHKKIGQLTSKIEWFQWFISRKLSNHFSEWKFSLGWIIYWERCLIKMSYR
jgi:hypothetical protein